MTLARLALAFVGVGLVLLASRTPPTPGRRAPTSTWASRYWPTCRYLPAAVADLLRSYPFDFLYGNIAADSSIAKHYAPLGRHCHYWHVGQEIHDLAGSDALRAFGLGYLCHLSADTVAHNYFVPRQLMLTSSTAAVGHSYWEARVESHLGDAYSKAAKDVILLDHGEADAHLDRIIAPTIFSVRTNRRLFRGMVRLTESSSWQLATQVAREYSRWPLEDPDVDRHLGLSFDFMIEFLRGPGVSRAAARSVGRAAAQEREGDPPEGDARRRTAPRRAAAGRRAGALRASRAAARLTGPPSPPSCRGARPKAPRRSPHLPRERRPLNAGRDDPPPGADSPPEGGFYREMFRSPDRVTLPDGRVRRASTAILYLLRANTWSAWHRVRSDEVWHHYEGAPLRLYRLGTATSCSGAVAAGGRPGGVWQAAEPIGGAVLCGCTVAPGFEFEDFEMGDA